MNLIFDKLKNNILLLFLVATTIILMQQGEINRDGVLYLTQSKLLINGEWEKAFALYNWPFFSILIALGHIVTGISLQTVAHSINIAMFILASTFFLKTVSFVSHNKSNQIFATLILLTSIPIMDDYLGMVLRDQGQWAGFMIGVYGYLRWVKNPQWAWALFWQLGFILGALFRPECLIFNILLPFTHQLFINKSERFKNFIQSVSLPIIGLLFFMMLWIIFGIESNFKYFVRLNEIIIRSLAFIENISQPLEIKTEHFYLRYLIADYVTSFKYIFLSYVAIYKWVAGVGFFHLILFFYAIKKQLISSPYSKVLFIFFTLSSVITITNLYTTYVLANRYWVMNFWIVYIFAAIGFGHLWQSVEQNKEFKKIILKRALVVISVIYFINIIIDEPGKHFEKEAGQWVKDNQIHLNDIFFSSKRAAYYAGYLAFDAPELNVATHSNKYRFIMITYDRFSKRMEIPNYIAIKYFPSQNNPKVIVYEKVIED